MTDSKESLMLLGIVALMVGIGQSRPILLVLTGITLMLIAATRKSKETAEDVSQSQMDCETLLFSQLCTEITRDVRSAYPNACWYWDTPSPADAIRRGEPVFIRLERAVGCRRARVNTALGVACLEYIPVKQPEAAEPTEAPTEPSEVTVPEATEVTEPIEEPEPTEPAEEPERPPEDYGFMACEWVDANALSIAGKCNEAIGQNSNVFIPAAELPAPESWECICAEVRRTLEIKDATPNREGIQIFMR